MNWQFRAAAKNNVQSVSELHRSSLLSSSHLPSSPIRPASCGSLLLLARQTGQLDGGCVGAVADTLNRDFWQFSSLLVRRCTSSLPVTHIALAVSPASLTSLIVVRICVEGRLKWRGALRPEARTSCRWQGRRDACGWQQLPSPLVSHNFRRDVTLKRFERYFVSFSTAPCSAHPFRLAAAHNRSLPRLTGHAVSLLRSYSLWTVKKKTNSYWLMNKYMQTTGELALCLRHTYAVRISTCSATNKLVYRNCPLFY